MKTLFYRTPSAVLAVLLLLAVGCRSPWPAGTETAQSPAPLLPVAQVSHDVTSKVLPASGELTSGETASGDSDAVPQEAALAAVLSDLEKIEAIDPAAKALLMADLRAAKRENWSLIVQQFKSALAYRRQLAAREMNKTVVDKVAPNLFPTQPVPQLAYPATSTPDAISVSFDSSTKSPASTDAAQETSPDFAAVATDAEPADDDLVRVEQAPARRQLTPPPSNPLRTAPATADRSVDGVQTMSFVAEAEPRHGWHTHLEAAIAELEKTAKPTPDTTGEVHEHMRLRMLHLLAGREDSAMAPIPGASAAEQQYWSKQLFALSTFFDQQSQPDTKRRAAGSLVHLDQARAKLAELATLQVRNLAFVDSVDGFGIYDSRDETKFRPGQHVTLYAEVENFRSESTKEGYRTELGTSYEVVDSRGQRVDHRQFPDVEDVCKKVRRDFHMQYGVDLPTRIYPGQYELRLIVTDQQSHKIGQASVPFEIVE